MSIVRHIAAVRTTSAPRSRVVHAPILLAAACGVALMAFATFAVPAPAAAQQPFTPEIALDVRTPGIVAVTEDGARVAVTLTSRRDRTDVDHQRFGDPTYISPVSTRLMVIDTRTGHPTWVQAEPAAQMRGHAWSPDGGRLAWFMVEDGQYRLRIYDAVTSASRTVPLRTDREIASSSPLVWSPDGARVLLGLRPAGWAEEARAAFHALTDAPVIVQDSRNDFLAWDRVRNLANRQETVLVSVVDGTVREVLSEVTPVGPGFSEEGSYITFSTATRTKTSYTRPGRHRVRALPAGSRGGRRSGLAPGHRRRAAERCLERRPRCLRLRRGRIRLRAAAGRGRGGGCDGRSSRRCGRIRRRGRRRRPGGRRRSRL